MSGAIDLDEWPELDDAWFDRASIKIGDAIVRRAAGDIGCNPEELTLTRDGAEIHRSILDAGQIEGLRTEFTVLAADRAGTRLGSLMFARALFAPGGVVGCLAAASHGSATRPVRAIYFDKTENLNWTLGWHQDRVICVQDRTETDGFDRWTRKAGRWHVSPPEELLAGMLTVRVHLDDVRPDNAPLLIAAGSHHLGRVSESDVELRIRSSELFACCARAGDVWVYATPILHASAKSFTPSRRRVLQIDYASVELPNGLRWHALI